MPERIQLRRTKGWRKPEGAVVVSRPSKWGNEFEVWRQGDIWRAEDYDDQTRTLVVRNVTTSGEARRIAAEAYRRVVLAGERRWDLPTVEMVREHLAGRDLACWCPPSEPCHADVLLEIANGGAA